MITRLTLLLSLLIPLVLSPLATQAQDRGGGTLQLPVTGGIYVNCGTITTLQDDGGPGNYSNNANGYAVLYNSPTGVITLQGTCEVEFLVDGLIIYNGEGTGGAVIGGNAIDGTVNFTSAPGQVITVQFVSDGSITYAGFNVAVSYSGCTGAPYVIPASGELYRFCGMNTVLLDPGGNGDYGNNVDGMAIFSSSGSAMVGITGTYVTESNFDFIRIYNGEGTGGALLATYSGNGSINFTGLPGQSLTVRFTSDPSITMGGFNLNVTYTGICSGSTVQVPTTGSISVGCGTSLLLQDNGGTENYSNNVNGSVVFQASGSAAVNFSGNYQVENNFDQIQLFDGTGTGGTLLATYTGTGSINYSGAPGQTITLLFVTDQSLVLAGFSIDVYYTGTCGPNVYVPPAGDNSVPCGSLITLQDHAGASNYSNNMDGYTVLESAGSAAINLSGSYSTEANFDFIRLYEGAGTGGALLATYSGTGTINYTALPGQTITVRFTSDFSVVNSGFVLNVSRTGSCLGPVSVVPASGSSSVDCGSTVALMDPGQNADYENNQDGYTVLNSIGSAQITVAGDYSTELNFDRIRIYDGAGTGGTLLATYSGNGTINYVANPGQTITVRFTSDFSIVGSGFELGVTYTGTCSNSIVLIPASGSTSVDCGVDVILMDHAGEGPYANLVDGQAVLNNAGTAVIYLNMFVQTEPSFDVLRIYDGVGTGGTLLQTIAGFGTTSYISQPGQTLTVRFTTNATLEYEGLYIEVFYEGNCDFTTDIAVEDDEPLRLFPNPATDGFTLAGGTWAGGTLQLVDATGRLVLQRNVPAMPELMHREALPDLPDGLYFVVLQQGAEQRTLRLTVQH